MNSLPPEQDHAAAVIRAFGVGACLGACLGVLVGMVAMALIARAML